ncbi:PaaI family thioesterase [Candidatus Sulfidibacterium hydrothermale]|uniref:PaaI family thioesterase n=1 Tax=Candidatus Sulfidibacterium hydrothermale TaxID=2875962 RepID=UPI001F0A0C0E|nr:PaaI family thioesterase [Candidatus Sulfidibacterium hydrothermale]UBM62039.1 PaaI family thioesterase [Candidatus Sulfidibacterium hydrothermale]
MKKIQNPYRKMEGYQCFGCAPQNTNGLQMNFMEEGDYVLSEWEPKSYFQGYYQVLHGGIQATLMDEIASWLVQLKLKTAGVTSQMTVRYKKTVPVNQGNIKLRAKLTGKRHNLADIHVELFCPDGELGAEADFVYFTFPEKVAIEKLHYPGHEAFYETS